MKRQYIESLAEDLEADTAAIGSVIQFDDAKITALSQMYQCYDTVFKNLTANSCMGELIKYSKVNRVFEMNDRTLAQLANAGGFRLLEKRNADSILAYQRRYKAYNNFQSTIYQEAQDNVRNPSTSLRILRFLYPLKMPRRILVQIRAKALYMEISCFLKTGLY